MPKKVYICRRISNIKVFISMEKKNKTKLTESVMDDVMSIEEAKRLTIESVRKIYEENGNL